jgi:tetratricopeptide (TPR) repeat protein
MSAVYRLWLRIRLPALIVAVCLGAVYWLTSDNPRQLLAEARQVGDTNPVLADQLLERCLAARPNFPEAQLYRCRMLGRLGYWDEAYGLYSTIKQPGKLPGIDLLEFARQAFAAQQVNLGRQAADDARRQDSTRVAALQLLLQGSIQRRQPERVLEFSQQLTALTPDDPRPWELLASYYRSHGEPLKAVEAYRAAYRLQSNDQERARLCVALGGLLLSLGDTAGTREVLSSLRMDTEPSPDYLLLEANLLRAEGKTAEALSTIQIALEKKPQMTMALYTRGLLNFDEGQLDAARSDLETVVKKEPSLKEAHFKLSQVYQRLGDAERAASELEISRKLTDAVLERNPPRQP